MPVMNEDLREKFLADLHVGVIAIARAEGPPLTVPVWYEYENGEVLVQTSPESVKHRLIVAAGEFSLVAQVETPPYQYVSVSGPVVAVEPTPWHDVERLAHRYLDDPTDFLRDVEGEPVVTLRMRPERWYSADFS